MTQLAWVAQQYTAVSAARRAAEEATAREWTDERFAELQARVLAGLRAEDTRFAAALALLLCELTAAERLL